MEEIRRDIQWLLAGAREDAGMVADYALWVAAHLRLMYWQWRIGRHPLQVAMRNARRRRQIAYHRHRVAEKVGRSE